MKTSELIGAALDWAVAKCEGNEIAIRKGFLWIPTECYSTDWAQGGPIIEREEIELKVLANCINTDDHPTFKPGDAWEANLWPSDGDLIEHCGPTPLVAAMRCYVQHKLGDEVEIPSEVTE